MRVSRIQHTILVIAFAICALSSATPAVKAAVTLSMFDARWLADGIASRVVVSWTTATEIQTAGFNLYRSARAEGPYTRINTQLIPAKNDALVGGTYQYFDTRVEAGQTYYYQLEDVEFNGTSARHKPVTVQTSQTQIESDVVFIASLAIGALMLLAGGAFVARRKSR